MNWMALLWRRLTTSQVGGVDGALESSEWSPVCSYIVHVALITARV